MPPIAAGVNGQERFSQERAPLKGKRSSANVEEVGTAVFFKDWEAQGLEKEIDLQTS